MSFLGNNLQSSCGCVCVCMVVQKKSVSADRILTRHLFVLFCLLIFVLFVFWGVSAVSAFSLEPHAETSVNNVISTLDLLKCKLK